MNVFVYKVLTYGTAPTGEESPASQYAAVESLSRSLMNDAGQATQRRQYFNLDGLAYSTDRELGVEGVNYLESGSTFDPSTRDSIATSQQGSRTV